MKKLSVIIWIIALYASQISKSHSQNSVLAEGSWYKIAVQQTGIYKISFDDLVDWGLSPAQVNPKTISLYGNGNGMLPEANDGFRYNDLQENAIFVFGENDEVFDPGDYILFYGEGPTEWKLIEETGLFQHQVNFYSDYTYYYITMGQGEGKRIVNLPEPPNNPTLTIQSFNNYYAHEEEIHNLIRSGKSWYGEVFSDIISYDYNLDLTGLISEYPIYLKSSFANRSFENCSMDINVNGELLNSVTLTSVNPSSTKYAQKKTVTLSFSANVPNITLNFTYNQPNDSAIAWLDYFSLNYLSELSFSENQLQFRSIESVGPGNITLFRISESDVFTKVWNVTDPINIYEATGALMGSQFEFKIETDSLLEFIAFKGSEFESPEFIGQIENQNLHGADPVDYIVVTHPDFLMNAQQLATFHETNDGLSTLLTTPELIYNEFSSGSPDVTAIRDFIKHLYDKSEGEKPRYLLLFGDGSYDPKDRIENNTNFIPTFQTNESLITASSYDIEDYYGYMDDSEGYDGIGDPDIGIGRIVATTADEAESIVNKIIHYQNSPETFGDWKNNICMIADDADGNLHLEQADSLATILSDYNISKLYFDFYQLVQLPEGPRYPEVETEITNQVTKGNLLMNYVGHGGVTGLGHEKVLEIEDLYNWNNIDKLPVMIAATCEFIRFDDPGFQSIGEQAMLMENGGTIAAISSTRLAYAQSNFAVNNRILEFFVDSSTQVKRLGDMIRYSKPPATFTTRSTILLGDPALKICLPKNKVVTQTINGVEINLPLDTINPGEQITVNGFIADFDGNLQSNFNGVILIKVFERPYIKTTLGNQPYSYPIDVIVQDSVMLEIQTEVINGQFEYSFTLPYGISQEYGKIKLSHYSFNESQDASGFFSEIVVGGQPSTINTYGVNDNFEIFPTLVTNNLFILNYSKSKSITAEIIDISGNTDLTFKLNDVPTGEKFLMDISGLSGGFYILKVSTDTLVSEFKFIKK
jgi:hypothetical protein